MGLTIWCNAKFNESAERLLADGTKGHRLVYAADRDASVLATGKEDPALATADVAFGQPDAVQCLAHRGIKWVEITSAGSSSFGIDSCSNTTTWPGVAGAGSSSSARFRSV